MQFLQLNYLKILIIICFTQILYAQITSDVLNEEFIKWKQSKKNEYSEEGFALGEIPQPFVIYSELPEYLKKQMIIRDYLPATYDLRTSGGVTSVKNQGGCGSCWTFAAMASIESRWLLSGKGTYDLSEDNLNTCHDPFVWEPCDGGNSSLAIAYFAKGAGPILEADAPYDETHTTVSCPAGLIPAGIVTSGWYIPSSDPDLLKTLIMDYGALATNMRYESSSYNSGDHTYYYSGSVSNPTNHAVTLVGWDDYIVTAGGVGAWIIKNSWGSGWGENGYFYIAYQDTKVNTSVSMYRYYKDYNQFETISTYSEAGYTSSYGYGTNSADALVKFTASDNIHISRIGTWTNYAGASVVIDIYDDFNGTNLLTGLLGSVSEQTCTYSGFNTFELDEPITIAEGNDYYVKVRYTTPGYNFPIPVEKAIADYVTPVIETDIFWIKSTGSSTWSSMNANSSDPCIYIYSNTNDITFAGGSSYTPPAPIKNTNNNVVGRFYLQSQTTGGSLTSATISCLSSGATGVEFAKLWISDDSEFGIDDTQLGSSMEFGNSITFNGFSAEISSSGKYLFVTLDLSDASGSVSAYIADNSALSFTGGTLTSTINDDMLSDAPNDLPVELVSFTANATGNCVELAWTTVSEINNYGFDIERCAGVTSGVFEKIGFVPGIGNSNIPRMYSFNDFSVKNGKILYRLKQIDIDGQYSYSSTIDIDISIPDEYSLEQNYPNPFNPSTTIRYSLPIDGHVKLRVYNSLGQEIITLVNEYKPKGRYEVKYDTSGLPTGLYVYRIDTGGFTDTKRMMFIK